MKRLLRHWFWLHPRWKDAAVGLAFITVIGIGTTLGLVVSRSDAAGGPLLAKVVSNGQTLTGKVVTVTTEGGEVRLVRYRTRAGKVRYISTTAPGVTVREPGTPFAVAGTAFTVTRPGATVIGPGQTVTQVQTVTTVETVNQVQTVTEVQTVVETVTETVTSPPP